MLIVAQLRAWQHEAGPGPARWQAAWDRAIALIEPMWRGTVLRDGGGDGELYADGGAALATALYLLAAERDVEPHEITRTDVEASLGRGHITDYPVDLPQRWGARLSALGHDLDSESDPVALRWRALCHIHPEPAHPEGDVRVGPAVTTGIQATLAPVFRAQLQF